MRDQGSVAREEAPGSPEEPPGRPAHLGPDAATLGRVLYAMRFSAVRVVTLAGVAPWSLRVDQEGASLLYLVRRGGAFLRFASEPTPQLLEPGDLAVLPLGRRHVLGEGGGAPDDLQVLLDDI
ncbi:MAG TPA: cupin domain-containing protein, partial [Polyangiaceae bacterium LLY-WYZ-14_1]|nr:cupin domain-containing protein [Polyangiaceae bacterium LLY-WYZ-14_1]